MTRTLYRLIYLAVALSLVHHVDHVLRGVTGWPLTGEVNPFTYSLLIYPVIAVGLVLSRRGLLGPLAWAAFSAGGAVFLTVVHVGPVAGDAVTAIPHQHGSPVTGALAIALLAALVAVLLTTFVYEVRLSLRARRAPRGLHPE
jgi:pilus assembly protein TadC